MKLQTVTLTGADDTIEPQDLAVLSAMYPFVEWGILIGSHEGPRFPSLAWQQRLMVAAKAEPPYQSPFNMRVSAHLCGRPLRDILLGNEQPIRQFIDLFEIAKRVQLNFHGEPNHHFDPRGMSHIININLPGVDIIFQQDGTNDRIMLMAMNHLSTDHCLPFYDMSHGTGVYPKAWPTAMVGPKMVGFAGGIGPDNVLTAINEISRHVPEDAKVWIDMETNIRSQEPGDRFDLDKCTEVLAKVLPMFLDSPPRSSQADIGAAPIVPGDKPR